MKNSSLSIINLVSFLKEICSIRTVVKALNFYLTD